ncbi:MAG: nucleoside triphosphate pyrophosphohydrolase [Chloroflexi bacterium]|nr:nucleoside triphosphate pyrophosphohydrolase [Chloroflexota bacterium]
MAKTALTNITIVGLGPGDASLLTVAARDAIASADEVWLRTSRHPTVPGLPAGPAYHSFDDVYEREPSFDAVYRTIVARVLELGRRPQGVVYAVPGHPMFGEASVQALLLGAAEEGLTARIVPGVSFVDTVAVALGVDPLTDGLLLLDALALGERKRLLTPQRPTIIAQVYDRRAASQAKLALLESYPPEHPVRVVGASGTGEERVIETTVASLDHDERAFDHLATLYVPPLGLVDDTRSFEGLRRVVAQLRNPDGGCPWDLEQTHETLKRYLLEEAYEALDALDAGEPHRLAEELGDLMMQVLLHAQVAEDEGEFTIEDVVSSIAAKLVRRHPHVFGDVEVAGAQEVLRNWETLKKAERADSDVSLLDHVPKAMPALAQAQSLQSRASKAGLGPTPVSAEALARAVRDLATSTDEATAERLGDLLFGIVALARARDLDAEEALRMAARRFRAAVESQEAATREAS